MYGIYSNNLERFLLIKDDVWMCMQTAKLLSSKFSLTVCQISDNSNINNNNCGTWGLIDTSMALVDRQIPRLIIVEDSIINLNSYPPDIEKEKFEKYRNFSNFVFNCVKSSRFTDACLNSDNTEYFLNLLDSLEMLEFKFDNFGTNESFLKQVDKILYLSENEEEIKVNLKNIFLLHSQMPSNQKTYEKIFYKYLNYYETIL